MMNKWMRLLVGSASLNHASPTHDALQQVSKRLNALGFKLLLGFSVAILIVMFFARPQNIYVALVFPLSWITIAIIALIRPDCRALCGRLWVIFSVPAGPVIVLQNGLLPATMVPLATLFPMVLTNGLWRYIAMTILACCTFLVPLSDVEYDSALWMRLSISNFIVTILVGMLINFLENALIESEEKSLALDSALESEQKATEAKSLFFASMSHEIRTPMNGILGLLDIVLQEKLPEASKKQLEKVKQSGVVLNTLLNDILDISKINAGKLEFKPTTVQFNKVLSNSVSIYQNRAKQKGISLRFDIDKNLHQCVMTDYVRLTQVFNNLISNAVKFTHNGEVVISIKVLANENDVQTVQIDVSDTGEGICKSALKNVFNAFEQVGKNDKTSANGAGLGLMITKGIVEQMQGEIDVESTIGKGSVFRVILPLQKSTEKEQNQDSHRQLDEFCGRILVVEDNDINQLVAKETLTQKGFEVFVAKNGNDAIAFLQDNTVDLILMDIHMPVMDGLVATQKIREVGNKTPIYAFTAALMEDEIELALASGMQGYLEKPINQRHLNKVLTKIFHAAA